MIRILPLAGFLLLAGCGQPDQAAPAANDMAQIAPAPQAAVPSLAGEWRITGVTGTPTSGEAMTIVFADGRASVTAGCLRRAASYTQDRNAVDFAAFSPSGGDCSRLPSAQEDLTFVALDDANLAIFGEDGSQTSLSGSGGTLALERR